MKPRFGRVPEVAREVGLGMSLGKALTNLSARMQNRDLDLVVTAINIHYQVGGNLSTMLAAVTETIRDRVRLFAEVRVITTQQRYTSYLLSLLPFFVGAILFLMNPEYAGPVGSEHPLHPDRRRARHHPGLFRHPPFGTHRCLRNKPTCSSS